MRAAAAIGWRDIRATYVSPFGIGCTAAFAGLAGVLLVLDLRGNQARLDQWFAPLFVALGVLAALLSTRAFADEERTGSLELLVTAPVPLRTIVAGKLLGMTSVLVVAVGATVACPLLVLRMGDPDFGPIVTGYVGLLFVGVAFMAVAVAVSAATGNPLVAAGGTIAALVALWFAGLVAKGVGGGLQLVLAYVSPSTHVTGFLRGTLAVTDVVYFVSLAVAGAVAATAILGARR